MKLISWNVNGLRAVLKKNFLAYLAEEDPDVLCLQETKCTPDDVEQLWPASYTTYWNCAEKKGYSGVGIYTRHQPDAVVEGLGVDWIDAEGRYIELQFNKVYKKPLSIVSLYLPSGSSGEDRQQVKFSVMERFYPHLEALKASGREVVVCGDWNIAHKEADLKNWKGNKKNSGFLPEERAWMTEIFENLGWVDAYRKVHPETTDECYTWWSNRGAAWEKNVGWRIDYQVTTPEIGNAASACEIYKAERFSDHAPLTIDYLY